MNDQQRWVLASNNAGKIREFNQLLAPWSIDVRPQKELGVDAPAETASTFVENALIKARHASRLTGLPALADDSGLAVDALNGEPGVWSARFAGADADDDANNRKLLEQMAEVPGAERTACFHCVLVLLRHAADPTPIICHGRWPGFVLDQPSGDGGFGYDPLFYVPSEGCSAAELPAQRKGQLSHRGQALAQLRARLDEHG